MTWLRLRLIDFLLMDLLFLLLRLPLLEELELPLPPKEISILGILINSVVLHSSLGIVLRRVVRSRSIE